MHLESKIKHTYYAVFSVQVHGPLRKNVPDKKDRIIKLYKVKLYKVKSYKAIPSIYRDKKGKQDQASQIAK